MVVLNLDHQVEPAAPAAARSPVQREFHVGSLSRVLGRSGTTDSLASGRVAPDGLAVVGIPPTSDVRLADPGGFVASPGCARPCPLRENAKPDSGSTSDTACPGLQPLVRFNRKVLPAELMRAKRPGVPFCACARASRYQQPLTPGGRTRANATADRHRGGYERLVEKFADETPPTRRPGAKGRTSSGQVRKRVVQGARPAELMLLRISCCNGGV